MLPNIISIGDKIDLRKISHRNKDNEEYEEKIYVSQLLEFISNNEALIAMPIINGRVIPLYVNDLYQLCFYTKNGLYQCKAVITSRSKENNIYTSTVTFLSDFEKYQRRNYFRLDCILDIEYRLLTPEEFQQMQNPIVDKSSASDDKGEYMEGLDEIQAFWEEGTVVDISGGGMRFISQTVFNLGDKLRIKLFSDGQSINGEQIVLGTVISSTRIPNKSGIIENRVSFVKISNEQREAIVKYIFQEQRRIRRKEKGLE